VLNLTLIWPLGTGGLALSTAICSYLQVIVLISVLKKRYPVEMMAGLWATIIKTSGATGFMLVVGAGGITLMQNMPIAFKYDLLRVGLLVTACTVSYIGFSFVFKSEMLQLLIQRRKH